MERLKGNKEWGTKDCSGWALPFKMHRLLMLHVLLLFRTP
jgi:hypothetical protein